MPLTDKPECPTSIANPSAVDRQRAARTQLHQSVGCRCIASVPAEARGKVNQSGKAREGVSILFAIVPFPLFVCLLSKHPQRQPGD